MLNEELEQLLKNLRLKRILEILQEELAHAQKGDSTYEEFLLRLLRAQWHHRQEAALEWRIKRARLPECWTIESFPFRLQKGVNRRQINTFAGLDFVPKAENLVFIGPTGVGKTGLATGLLLKALQNGYRALFIKAQDLFDDQAPRRFNATPLRLSSACCENGVSRVALSWRARVDFFSRAPKPIANIVESDTDPELVSCAP